MPDVAPADITPKTPVAKVPIDPRLALGLGLGCMAIGMAVMWKINSKRPCKGCKETQFVQVPTYAPQPQAQPQRPVMPSQAAPPAPEFQDPTSHPNAVGTNGYVPGTLVFDKSGQGPGPKMADPPAGFAPPVAPVPEGGLRFA